MTNKLMVFEVDGIRFEKLLDGNIVNIYENGVEFDVFTDYTIGSDFEKFKESCMETYNVMEEK